MLNLNIYRSADRSCTRYGDGLSANAVGIIFFQHLRHKLLRHIDIGVSFLDADGADGVTGDVGMVGDGAHHIVGTDAIDFACAESESYHAFFMRAVAAVIAVAVVMAVAAVMPVVAVMAVSPVSVSTTFTLGSVSAR